MNESKEVKIVTADPSGLGLLHNYLLVSMILSIITLLEQQLLEDTHFSGSEWH